MCWILIASQCSFSKNFSYSAQIRRFYGQIIFWSLHFKICTFCNRFLSLPVLASIVTLLLYTNWISRFSRSPNFSSQNTENSQCRFYGFWSGFLVTLIFKEDTFIPRCLYFLHFLRVFPAYIFMYILLSSNFLLVLRSGSQFSWLCE